MRCCHVRKMTFPRSDFCYKFSMSNKILGLYLQYLNFSIMFYNTLIENQTHAKIMNNQINYINNYLLNSISLPLLWYSVSKEMHAFLRIEDNLKYKSIARFVHYL